MQSEEPESPLEGERIDELGRGRRVYSNGLQPRVKGAGVERSLSTSPDPRKNEEDYILGL